MLINEKLTSCHDFPEQIVISYKKKKSPYKLNMIDVYNKSIVPIDIILHNGLVCEATKTRSRPSYYLIEKRLIYKKQRKFQEADNIRTLLSKEGIVLDDINSDSTLWRYDLS